MIRVGCATKFTRMHMDGDKNPSNEPHTNRKAGERHLRKAAWEARKNKGK